MLAQIHQQQFHGLRHRAARVLPQFALSTFKNAFPAAFAPLL